MIRCHRFIVVNAKGAIGIGAMIVFIAMVLVAGIAASVLVQTTTKLETQAIKSGQETTSEVSTGLAVENIEGHKSGTSIDEIGISVRPRAGTTFIDLSETVIEISDSSKKNLLVFDSTGFTDTSSVDGDFFTLSTFDGSSTQFRVIVLQDADGSCDLTSPVINRGDHVMLCVDVSNVFGGLTTNDDIFGTIIIEEGKPGPFDFSIPGLSNNVVYDLL